MKSGKKLLLLLGFSLLLTLPATAEVTAHIRAAEGYMAAGQWDYANYEWRNILSENPQNIDALVGLGRSLMQAGMTTDAVAHLEESRLKTGANIRMDMALADAYVAAQRFVRAHYGYQFVLDNDPNNVEAYRKLRLIQDRLPVKYREQVTQFLDKKAQAAKERAVKALERDDYRQALKHLELLGAYTEDARVHNNYALSLLLTGDTQTAARTFYNLSHQKPEQWKIHANAAMALLGIGNSYKARQELERAIGLCDDNKDRARLYNNLGYAYEAARKPTYARFAYERAIAMNPGLIKAHMNLGYIFQQLMEYDNAEKAYKKLLTIRPNHAEAWNQLGFTYELKQDSRKAVAAYKKALLLDSGLESAYFNLGTLYKKMDQIDKASEVYRKMVSREFGAFEQGRKPVQQKEPDTRQAKLIEYVYLYFDDLS